MQLEVGEGKQRGDGAGQQETPVGLEVLQHAQREGERIGEDLNGRGVAVKPRLTAANLYIMLSKRRLKRSPLTSNSVILGHKSDKGSRLCKQNKVTA